MAIAIYTPPIRLEPFVADLAIERKSCNTVLTFDGPNFLNNRSREACKMQLGRDLAETQLQGDGDAPENDRPRWDDVVTVSASSF